MSLRRSRWAAICLAALAMLAGWVVRDLSASTVHDLYDFNPHEVARLETAAWRSYYAHDKLRLFAQMAELFRKQYRMPFWQSWFAAYYAAHAAVVFQPGHSRGDYERAMPDLIRLYALVHRHSSTNFSVDDVAGLELEWWIVHRERESHAPADLERALASLQAKFYQRPETIFATHARARAEAMAVRDSRAAEGSLSEEDWQRIGSLLDDSWASLKAATAQ